MIIPSARRGAPCRRRARRRRSAARCVAWHYHRLGLTLSHYDARGHLVVARRIFDSITPGWQQIGAVWLPLPHLLNALPVQVDAFYRTGASARRDLDRVVRAWRPRAIAWIVASLTGSAGRRRRRRAVFALNPNVLYLQATPMTEPLLLALTTLARGAAARLSGSAGCIGTERRTRAAPSAGCGVRARLPDALRGLAGHRSRALAAAAWARWRRGDAPAAAVAARRRPSPSIPPSAIVGFAVFSRVVVGAVVRVSGFFVPENKALGQPGRCAVAEIVWGTRDAERRRAAR